MWQEIFERTVQPALTYINESYKTGQHRMLFASILFLRKSLEFVEADGCIMYQEGEWMQVMKRPRH